MTKYSIITENDVSNWEDNTGSQYHFPKRYLKYLDVGTKVIYYKGRIKDQSFSSERLSKAPHYFGIGIIGEIRQDFRNSRNYFATIEDYCRFKEAVHFRDSNGTYLEVIPENKKTNYWRDAVRPIDKRLYKKIRQLATLELDSIPKTERKPKLYPKVETPPIDLSEEDLLRWYEKRNRLIRDGSSTKRYSKNAKKTGDRGERLVLEHLKKNNYTEIDWHAQRGDTPGYDISCLTPGGKKIFIEVKTTSGKSFANFQMTKNEVDTAKELGNQYKIFLVADCYSMNPKFQIINNPTSNSDFKFTPSAFMVYKEQTQES